MLKFKEFIQEGLGATIKSAFNKVKDAPFKAAKPSYDYKDNHVNLGKNDSGLRLNFAPAPKEKVAPKKPDSAPLKKHYFHN